MQGEEIESFIYSTNFTIWLDSPSTLPQPQQIRNWLVDRHVEVSQYPESRTSLRQVSMRPFFTPVLPSIRDMLVWLLSPTAAVSNASEAVLFPSEQLRPLTTFIQQGASPLLAEEVLSYALNSLHWRFCIDTDMFAYQHQIKEAISNMLLGVTPATCDHIQSPLRQTRKIGHLYEGDDECWVG